MKPTAYDSTTTSGTQPKKVTKRTNYILYTLSTEYTQQAFTRASRICHRMCSMQVSKLA